LRPYGTSLFGRSEIILPRIQHPGQRAKTAIELIHRCHPNASVTAFGAWPGVTAKVVDGVNAMSRRAAAATKVANADAGRLSQGGLERRGLFEPCQAFCDQRRLLPFPRALPIKTTDAFGAYARRIYASLGLGAAG
jgi:hypothetical protein